MTYRAVVDPPGYIIRHTTISVDYWPRTEKTPITHHFLTHAHSDHLKGLDSTWTHGVIHCTKVFDSNYISKYIILIHFQQKKANKNDTYRFFKNLNPIYRSS
jgi:hypothetical protein